MTPRFSLYNDVHKGLRQELFGLLTDTGRADPRDRAAAMALCARTESLLSLLAEHAVHEETFIEPLLESLRPDLAAEIRQEHELLDARIRDVHGLYADWARPESGTAELAGAAYLALAGFSGAYASHMSREEDEIMPLLQAALTDDELQAVSARLRATVAPGRMAQFMSHMLPAMNVDERTAVFAGLKANAPPEALLAMSALAEQVLRAEDWSAVKARVGL